MLLDLSDDPGVADVRVKTLLVDAHRPRLKITDADLATRPHSNSWGLQVYREDRLVLDTRRKSLRAQ
ncbi:hypothetical protein D3C83_271620 [compost metagenome]